MKITIPVLDQYLDSCQNKGEIALFESFTESNPETVNHIDVKLFETYRDYKNESRIISLLEYQAIKSYAQFLEEGDEDEIEDSEEEVEDTEEVVADEPEESEESSEEPENNKLADMPEDGEEEEEDDEEEEDEEEDDDDDDDDDDEVTDESKLVEEEKVKQAEMESEKKSKVAELPATDDDFGVSIDIEELTKDIDKTFKDIEQEILTLGEPEKHSEKEGTELVGEDVVNEAQEDTNIIIDWLFRAPKIRKTVKKATDLKIKGVEAQDKVNAEIDKRNEAMKQKIDAAKAKGLDVSKMKELARKKISDFEDTLQKRVDAADEAAKDIEDEAEEMATSNYLKRVLSKAKVESRLQVANAKMQAADKEDQVEIRDDIKDLTVRLKDAEDAISDADKEIAVKKKELGLGEDDIETLGEINDEIDKIKDKEAVQRKKGDNPDAQKVLQKLEGDKLELWKKASPILDKVKDKEKKSSMFRTLTGNDEINNGAELEDYIETKTKESEDKIAAKKDPVKDFLKSEDGKGFSKEVPAKEELDQYETKTIKDAEDNNVTLYKKKEQSVSEPTDPVKDFLASEDGKGYSTTKPSDEELDQFDTKTIKDKDGNEVTVYKKKEVAASTDPVKDFLASEDGKGYSTTKPADTEIDQYETKTVKDAEGNDVTLYKKKEQSAGEPVTASVDNSIYESVANRFRKAMTGKIV